MSFVFFGSYDARLHPRIRVLIEGVTALGHEVFELNEALGIGTAGRIRALRSPLASTRFLIAMLRSWRRLWQRRRDVPYAVEAVVVGHLGLFDVHLARRLFPRTAVVLDLLVLASDTARSRRLIGDVDPRSRILHWIDERALRAADLVLVDTAESALLVHKSHRIDERRLVVCAVGATQDWFQAAAGREARGSEEPLKVCYFGLFTPFHGTVFIAEAARRLRDQPIEFTFVGTGQDRAAAVKAAGEAHIHWIDWVAAADLPRLVAAHDVCLGVFGPEEKTARVVPMKVYQGAAAGCAVVTASSPPIARAFGDSVVMVPPARADLLADALRALQEDRGIARRYGERASRAADAFRPAAVARVASEAVANLRAE